MRTELKARVKDIQQIEAALLALGARFDKEYVSDYVYFQQPPGKVLKLTSSQGIMRKTVIERNRGMFKIVANEAVEDPSKVEAQLAKQYGLKKRLSNVRRLYTLDDQSISTNQIDGIGNFLIIEAEHPDISLLEKLKIGQDAIVTDSFDNLHPCRNE